MTPGENFRLLCYPADETFESSVRAAVGEVSSPGLGAARIVEQIVHDKFPNARISVCEASVLERIDQTTWIAFRDAGEPRTRRRASGTQPAGDWYAGA
jgi:hypothetical protein